MLGWFRTKFEWCKDHTLSVTCLCLGMFFLQIGIWFTAGEGMWWDIWSGVGLAFATVGGYGLLSGPLVEKNKPEEPPED